MILSVRNCQDGEVVYVDVADYPVIKDYRWRILRQKRDGYTKKYVTAHVYENKDWTTPKIVYLHRLIMKPAGGLVVDHISGDGLDNRRSNLRVVTKSQNGLNRNSGRTSFGNRKY